MSDLFSQFGVPSPTPFNFNLKVFVAESANELRLFLANHLQKLGFTDVRSSRDGMHALMELKAKPADIIFADRELTGVPGLDLLKELREDPAYQRGAFILMSKVPSKEEIMLAVESGIDDFIVKPFPAGDVLPKIRSAYTAFTNPKNPERLYEFAKTKLRANDLATTKKIYEALAASAKNAARPMVGLARVAIKENKSDEAMKYLTDSLARNDKFVHAYALRGELHVKKNDVPNALQDLQMAVDLSPLNLARYHGCCDLLVKENQIDTCIKILDRGISSGLENPYLTERLAFCHYSKKDYTTALKYYKDAVKHDPNNSIYAMALGNCYREVKNFDESIAVYNSIIKREPENYDALFEKGATTEMKGDLTEAVRLLERIMKAYPEHVKTREYLPALYQREQNAKKK